MGGGRGGTAKEKEEGEGRKEGKKAVKGCCPLFSLFFCGHRITVQSLLCPDTKDAGQREILSPADKAGGGKKNKFKKRRKKSRKKDGEIKKREKLEMEEK